MGVVATDRRRDYQPLQINGHVRYPNGLPASQIRIAAFDVDMGTEQLLGEAVTDDRGTYSIEYTADLLLEPERRSANLSVRAYDASNAPIGQSEIHYGVRGKATIDLTTAREQTRLRSIVLWLISRLRGV